MFNDQQPSNQSITSDFFNAWKLIIQHMPYVKKLLLRGLSKDFMGIYAQATTLPALTSQEIKDAENYLRTHNNKIAEILSGDRSFSVSPNSESQSTLKASVISSNAHIENGMWVDDFMQIFQIPVQKVKEKAQRQVELTLTRKFDEIPTHHERAQFINCYLSLPFGSKSYRLSYLENQSAHSLQRLVKSLMRRKDTSSMLEEVKQVLATKVQEENLTKGVKKLTIS